MLDTTTTTLTMTPAWRDHLSYGDIVSFRFPLAEEASTGKPKARPCLVLDIEIRDDDQRYALLAYGTTSRRRSNVGYEIHVRRRDEYLPAGLDEPTPLRRSTPPPRAADTQRLRHLPSDGLRRARPPRRCSVRRHERGARPHPCRSRHCG